MDFFFFGGGGGEGVCDHSKKVDLGKGPLKPKKKIKLGVSIHFQGLSSNNTKKP